MDCDSCQQKLNDFHEDELRDAEAEEIRAHLDECPRCAEEYDRLSAVVSAVRSLDTVQPPPHLVDNIKTALDQEDTRRSQRTTLRRVGPIIAAAACVIIVVGVVLQQGGMLDSLSSKTPAPISSRVLTESASTPSAAPSAPAGERETTESAVAEESRVAERATGSETEDNPASGSEAPEPQRAPPTTPSSEMSASAPRDEAQTEAAAGESSGGETADAAGGHEAPQAAAANRTAGPAGPGGASGSSAGIPPEADYMEGDAAEGTQEVHLMKSARKTGAIRELQARFIPPRTRQVGRAVTCAVEIDSATHIPQLAVRVETRQGLKLQEASDGYVYRGPIQADETKTVEFRINPTASGTHRVRITLETPDGKLESQMEATLPGFVQPPRDESLNPLGGSVSVDFHETPVRHALLEVAREGQINLVLDTSQTGPRVTYSCEDTPAGAVVRILAEDAGYSVEFEHDTYFVGVDN